MTFIEHLTELRSRLLCSLLAVATGLVLVFLWREPILLFIAEPVAPLRYYAPTEAFFAHLQLAFYGGLFLSLPILLHQVWLFFAPALYPTEKRFFSLALVFASLFLLLSLGFLYYYLPWLIHFCFRFGRELARPAISYQVYISFVGRIILLFGLTFELPLIFYLLARIGLINPGSLAQKRSHASLLILFLAALLTPPDLISLLLLSLPLLLLYQISILFSYLGAAARKNYAG